MKCPLCGGKGEELLHSFACDGNPARGGKVCQNFVPQPKPPLGEISARIVDSPAELDGIPSDGWRLERQERAMRLRAKHADVYAVPGALLQADWMFYQLRLSGLADCENTLDTAMQWARERFLTRSKP